jgi:cell division protein FtsB
VEILAVLEEKIASLIELVKELKAENAKLAEDNAQLLAKIEMLESSLTNDVRRLEELNIEKALTKDAVNSLIISINELVETQS